MPPASYADYLNLGEKSIAPRVEISKEEASELFPDGVPRLQDASAIDIRAKQVIALHVAGFKNVDIAAEVGYSPTRVSSILHHPSAKRMIEDMMNQVLDSTVQTVKNRFKAHANEALNTTLQLMRLGKNERVRLEAARDVFKGSGVFDAADSEKSSPIDNAAAKILADTMRELSDETEEFPPIGNAADVADIRKAAEESEAVEELLHETS